MISKYLASILCVLCVSVVQSLFCGDPIMNQGFIKLQRSPETWELLKDKNAFILLTVIALRARRTDEFNLHNLQSGEALLGDHRHYGMTQHEYRSAMRRLARWRLAVFQGTSRGTVARLLGQGIYDINEAPPAQADGERSASPPQAQREQTATNKNEKKEKKEKKYAADSVESRLAQLLWSLMAARKPDFRWPDLDRWAVEIDRMLRLDGRTPERIEAVLRWCQKDPFWQNNILSTAALRKHFDRLELEMARHPAKESIRAQLARLQQEDPL